MTLSELECLDVAALDKLDRALDAYDSAERRVMERERKRHGSSDR